LNFQDFFYKMEVISEPATIIVDKDTILCPCCNLKLLKKTETRRVNISGECSHCSFDKPFGWSNPYDRCSCEYADQEYLLVTCEKCLSPSCVKCGKSCDCEGKGCNKILCTKCIKDREFSINWKKSSPAEKLNFYGIGKLKLLAEMKKIKDFEKYNKQEIIDILSPLVSEKDFPIRKIL
jgi:hypothetical protein